MVHSGRTSVSTNSRVFGQLVADRKKTILAAGLLAIMAIMWGRVLTGKKTQPASAASDQPEASEKAETPAVKLHFFELPVIEGRNDRIGRDVFSADALSGFRRESTSQGTGTDTEVRAGTTQQIQEVVDRVAKRVTLVVASEGNYAYIDDQLVGVGKTFSVTEGETTYVFEVVRIQDDSVLVRCNGREFQLKLTP